MKDRCSKGNSRYWNDPRGFTLIEILVTLVVTGILMMVATTLFFNLSQQVEQNACKESRNAIKKAQTLFYTQHLLDGEGSYATSIEELTPYLVGNKIPVCPSEGSYSLLPKGDVRCSIHGR